MQDNHGKITHLESSLDMGFASLESLGIDMSSERIESKVPEFGMAVGNPRAESVTSTWQSRSDGQRTLMPDPHHGTRMHPLGDDVGFA